METTRPPQLLSAISMSLLVADAAYVILNQLAREFSGNFCIDDTLLAEHGVTSFAQYRVDPNTPLQQDIFVPADIPPPAES